MMPLGLRNGNQVAYNTYVRSTHDYKIALDVLRIDGTAIASITPVLLDGQVNINAGENVQRTATFTVYDPERQMHLDAESPWDGAIFADRMIRVRHTVDVPGIGEVEAIPFVGPVVKLSRDGDTLAVECQDKASLGMTGSKPMKLRKGMNAVNAVRKILRDGTGERHFRGFPAGNRRQLPRTYNVGWAEDATPWLVARRIATNVLGMDLIYSCDGYATLRPKLPAPAIAVTGEHLTSRVAVEFDVTEAKNRIMVNGTIAPTKAQKRQAKKKNKTAKGTKTNAVAQLSAPHPLAPGKLGRNGVPRWLPLIDSGQTFKSAAQARQRAARLLNANRPMTAGVRFDMVPVFHLDNGDRLRVETDGGFALVRLTEASIPLGVSGDMSVGQTRNVARGKRA